MSIDGCPEPIQGVVYIQVQGKEQEKENEKEKEKEMENEKEKEKEKEKRKERRVRIFSGLQGNPKGPACLGAAGHNLQTWQVSS